MPSKYVGLFDDDPVFAQETATTDTALGEGFILDFISGDKSLKETPKEQVRQRIARALFHEYGISVEDMEADFPIPAKGRRRNLDIAIFHHGQNHVLNQISRVVVCRQEPQVGKNTLRIRDYEQASSDLEELKTIMESIESCKYGLWTNGLEFFYLEKKTTRFDVLFEPIGDWPMSEESLGSRDVVSLAMARRADPDMLRIAFRRCHNFIHGNEGMPKDAAFWQFLYLIFSKLHDERAPRNKRSFWAGPKEQFDDEGRKAIRARILPLFSEVKQQYKHIFSANEEITLSDRALAFMVSELSRYEFARADVDAKGAAYQEIVGDNLRGNLGQYFTPRGVVKLAVEMLDPMEHEQVLDPACGTGGFLVATLAYMLAKFRAEKQITPETEDSDDFRTIQERLREYAGKRVFGADFDPFLIKASQMNMVMAGDGHGHLYHINSLEFPNGHLEDLGRAKSEIPFGTMDVVMTNPPFGADIPIIERHILQHFELAHIWERLEDGNFRNTGKLQGSVPPDVLFLERCLQWLRPGGRMAIVLPNGILGNPADEYIRWWVLRHAQVLASVEVPVEAFIVGAHVNILTSLLVLRKKSEEEIRAEDLGSKIPYKAFMAVAEKVGFDRRGNKLYKRTPDGEEITELREEIERFKSGDTIIERKRRGKEKLIDDDLPEIAQQYRAFLKATQDQRG